MDEHPEIWRQYYQKALEKMKHWHTYSVVAIRRS